MQIRTPAVASFLQDVALRDLAVHATHAVCVDGRGDVYQWGDGFFEQKSASDDRKPLLTLQGKVCPPLTFTLKWLTTTLIFRDAQNITRVQVTESRIFALSASGKVYVISSEAAQQKPNLGAVTPSSASWWGTGWFWGGETGVQHFEIEPSQQLAWREKWVILLVFGGRDPTVDRRNRIISIAAGRDHLLALTSSGRTFVHPFSKDANTHGQLGFRKFDIPDPSCSTSASRLHVELTPRTVADPYAKNSRYARESPSGSPAAAALLPVSENLMNLDDRNLKFSDRLFEGPDVIQIAAGSRGSFRENWHGKSARLGR
jgi:hypothetical protein